MKKIIFFLFCSLSYIVVSGQSIQKVDSLKERLLNYKNVDEKRARLLLNLAFYCQPPEGLQYAKEAINVSRAIKNKEYEGIAWEYLGTQQRQLGNYLDAINSHITASQLYKDVGFPEKEALIYELLGTNFIANNDYVNGLKYMRRSIPLYRAQSDSLSLANIYTNIGESYRLINQLDSAEFYFNRALKIQDYMGKTSEKTLTIGNLGLIHSTQKRYELAKSEIGSAIKEFSRQGDHYLTSYFQSEMADIFIKEDRKKEGEELLQESLIIAKNARLKEQIRDISLKLAEFYEKENNFAGALLFQKQYKIYDDSLKNVENVRLMEQQQSKFELTKLEEEVTSLNRINKLQRNLAFILSAGVTVFTVLSFLLVRLNKIAKKTNIELNNQKQLVEKREREKALLLRELNHRVKNNLQMVASLLNLQARQLKGHPAAEALISCKYRVEALTLMHQKLYRDDVDTSIDLKDYIEELSNNLVMNFGQEYQLKLNLESFRMNIDKAIPLGLIMNEIITNSLKYGKADNKFPVLVISVKNIEGKVILSISDNGKGLPENFDWRSSNSFGLKLVHSLVSQLEGEIDYKGDNGSNWILNLDKQKLI